MRYSEELEGRIKDIWYDYIMSLSKKELDRFTDFFLKDVDLSKCRSFFLLNEYVQEAKTL